MAEHKSALIGCGAIARQHLAALRELPATKVVAVCDLSQARAEAAAERFGVGKSYVRYQDMLTDIRPDLVHITTPPDSHFDIARDCLSAGLNVLCEKPITVNYSEFRLLQQLAKANDCILLENQHNRYHSSIQRINHLLHSGQLGEILEAHICVALNIVEPQTPYADRNAPHFGLALPGGVIGDFLPHMAYLIHMFVGPIHDLRTIWTKHTSDLPLPADEFRGIIKGERATGYLSFSGNAKPDGFWIRIVGTRMRVEANLFEPPRFTLKRFRLGEPALATLVDGLAESRDVLRGTIAGFWRKLSGTGSYDGLSEFIARTYRALEHRDQLPISPEELDETTRLVDRLAKQDHRL